MASGNKLFIIKFDINYIQDLDDQYRISVREKLKQTKTRQTFRSYRTIGFSRGQGTLCCATFEGIYPPNGTFALRSFLIIIKLCQTL